MIMREACVQMSLEDSGLGFGLQGLDPNGRGGVSDNHL